MAIYKKTIIYVVEGDIITSKQGFLQSSSITDNKYICKKLKVLVNNCFEVIGEKEEVSLKKKSPIPPNTKELGILGGIL